MFSVKSEKSTNDIIQCGNNAIMSSVQENSKLILGNIPVKHGCHGNKHEQ